MSVAQESSAERAPSKRPIVVGAIAIVVLVALIAVTWLLSRPAVLFGGDAASAARDYALAIADLDAERAAELSGLDLDDDANALLRPEVLETATASIRVRDVLRRDESETAATYSIGYELGDDEFRATIELERVERAWPLPHAWIVTTPMLVDTEVVVERAPEVAIGPVRVPTTFDTVIGWDPMHVARVQLYPGAYPVALPDNPLYAETEEFVAASVEHGARERPFFSRSFDALTPAHDEWEAILDECAEQEVAAPAGCPLSVEVPEGTGPVSWSISTVDVHLGHDGSVRAEAQVEARFGEGDARDREFDTVRRFGTWQVVGGELSIDWSTGKP